MDGEEQHDNNTTSFLATVKIECELLWWEYEDDACILSCRCCLLQSSFFLRASIFFWSLYFSFCSNFGFRFFHIFFLLCCSRCFVSSIYLLLGSFFNFYSQLYCPILQPWQRTHRFDLVGFSAWVHCNAYIGQSAGTLWTLSCWAMTAGLGIRGSSTCIFFQVYQSTLSRHSGSHLSVLWGKVRPDQSLAFSNLSMNEGGQTSSNK